MATIMVNNDTGSELKISEHLILKNLWEYYIIEDGAKGNIRMALVMGVVQEIGSVDMEEIKPYVLMRQSENLTTILPAEGYRWKEETKE